MMRSRILSCVAACALAFTALPVDAHEGTLRVTTIQIEGDEYVVDVPIEPLATLNRIELAAGEELTDSEVDAFRRLSMRVPDVNRALTIIFITPAQHVRATPRVVIGPRAVELRGAVPAGSTHLRFRNALASGDSVVALKDGPVESRTPLHGDEASVALPLRAPVSRIATFAGYLRLGVLHILPRGLDHILFILALFFLSSRIRTLLAQVSTFTVAHTLTLGAAMYGLVRVPPGVVEPLIALSIAFVAIQNLRGAADTHSRIAVVAAFGLLHGLGFASALSETGLPADERLLALAGFNCGVELAQLLVVGAAALTVKIASTRLADAHRRIAVPLSVVIAVIGLCWTIVRIV